MKKKLLYLTSIVLFSAASINAQTTVWDFGNSKSSVNDAAATAAWPIDATGVVSTTPVITVQKDLLNLTSHTTSTTNFAVVATGSATFTDGYTGANTLKTGGTGAPSGLTPTVRFFSFNVSGPSTVKVWFRHGSGSGVDRTVFVTNGTTSYGSAAAVNTAQIGTPPAANPLSNAIATASVTAAGIVYVYADNGVSVYKIEVTGATVNTPALATDSFHKESDVVVYANDGKINLSNIKSSTKVEVYNVLGALVQSAQADADTTLAINSGVYIVKAQSADGQKTVKVIVQ